MVERIDRDRIIGLTDVDLDKFVESDFKIRSGLCPNGHGLLLANDFGQSCPLCLFSTNVRAELREQ